MRFGRWRALATTAVGLATILVVGCREGGGAKPADSQQALYQDNFEGSAGSWHLEADDLGRAAVEGGQLVIEVSQANAVQYATLREPAFTDFDLTVEATLAAGGAGASYGVMFRMVGPDQFYRLEVTGDGRYTVERRDVNGEWTRLLDGWQSSEAIKPGQGQANTLRIVAQGAQLSFYANGERLRTLDDRTYGAGTIALDVGTFGPGGATARFDNLIVTAP